jgi:hypothetical protein
MELIEEVLGVDSLGEGAIWWLATFSVNSAMIVNLAFDVLDPTSSSLRR